jgi:uncharacterized repeat protein (TIGR01451 family)
MARTIHRSTHRPRRRRAASVLTAALTALGGLLALVPNTSPATAGSPLTVSATAKPTSGGTVQPGDTITYILEARSAEPLSSSVTVVDDLSDLLTNAELTSSKQDLATQDLTLDAASKELTWTLPALGADGAPRSTTASFTVRVAADAPADTKLITAAAPAGSRCAPGDLCATTLTVTAAAKSPSPDPPSAPSKTPTPSADVPTPDPKPSKSDPTAAEPSPSVETSPTSKGEPTTSASLDTKTAARAKSTDKAKTTDTTKTAKKAPSTTTKADSSEQVEPFSVVNPGQPCPTTGQTANQVVQGFEIDGNCQVNVAGNLDWESPAVGDQPVDRDGLGDNTQYTSGSEGNWPNWTRTTGGGSASGQADINDVYSVSTRDPATDDIWEMFGFSRAGSSGSIGYTLEVNQLPNRSANPAIPDRTTGDWRFNLTQNGSRPLALADCQRWTSAGPSSGSWTAVSCPAGDFLAATSTDGLFLEAAMNLTALTGQVPGCDLIDKFSTINFRSRQSQQFDSSALKDYIEPIQVTAPQVCLDREMTTTATNVTLGGSVTDTATLTATGGGPTPAGTVTFRLFGPSAAPDCSGAPVFTSGPVTLVNGVATSPAFTPSAAGNYHWMVSYSGEANYLGLTSDCGETGETSSVARAAVAIATSANDATLPDASISDSATESGVDGGPTPTGTLIFTAYGPTDSDTPVCDTAAFTSDPIELEPGQTGTVQASASFHPTTAGNYFWRVSYSGDSNYAPVTTECGDDNEQSVVSKAEPVMATTATSGAPGQEISDSAVLSRIRSPINGTVTFSLYGPFPDSTGPECTAANLAFQSTGRPLTEVNGGSAARAASEPFVVPLDALGMRYFWVASYTGDDNNVPVVSECGANGETSLVRGTLPTITTTATDTITLGESITDAAEVSGPAGQPTPTGTVRFLAYPPDDPECVGNPLFESDAIDLVDGQATSDTFTPPAVGSYRWRAAYSGDDEYIGLTSACNAAGETSVVTKAIPSISTQATSVQLGSSPSDTATDVGVTGVAGMPAPTGTVTFTAYGPSPTPDCTGQPAFDSGPVALRPGTGPVESTATASFTPPPEAGSYYWRVSYSGDDNYAALPPSPCGETGETSTVTPAAPSIATRATTATLPDASVSDAATVTGIPGAPIPTGTVTFRLYGPSDTPACTGDPAFGPATVPLTDGTATSPEFSPTVAGDYFWLADYSGDANYEPVTSTCDDPNEKSPITKSAVLLTSSATHARFGDKISDTGLLVGVGDVAPTGTVTFTAYGPTDSDEPVCEDVAFVQAGTDLLTTSPGTATADASFTPSEPGRYFWRISYSGDSNYVDTVSDCGALDEESRVTVPSIDIQKTASPDSFGEAGEHISYHYLVTNTGDATLDDVRVTDPHAGLSTISCAPAQGASLEPGDTMTCTAAYTTTQADLNVGEVTNTATAVGAPPTGADVTDTDQAVVTANQGPAIAIEKTADPTEFGAAGTPVTYSYRVINTGNVTLDDVRVSDPHAGLSGISCAPALGASLDPGDQMTCTAHYVTTQTDVNAGEVTNTATVVGTPPSGPNVTDTDQAVVIAGHDPAIQITKTASPDSFGAAGTSITYSYHVTNTGNVTLNNVRVTDPHAGLSDLACAPTQGASLDPGEQMTCTAAYTTTRADVNAGDIADTATVTGVSVAGDNVIDSDEELVVANHDPAIDIDKTAEPTEFGAAGTPITYNYLVTNTGNVTLTDVRVTDPHAGLSAVSCAPAQGTDLDPGDTMTCTAAYTTTQADLNRGDVTNTATVVGSPPTGANVTDTDHALVTATHDPAIQLIKTASPDSFGAVDTPITYTYRVINTGNVTLDDVRVTDLHGGLSALDCDPAQGTSLDPGAVITCTADYVTTQADLNVGSITDTATAFGSPPTGPGVSDTDQALVVANHAPAIDIRKSADPTAFSAAGTPIAYSFVVTNTGNVTLDNVQVTDPLDGMSAITCDPAQGASLEPGDQLTCTASYMTTQADLNRGEIANTATVIGSPPTGPSVSASDEELITASQGPDIRITKTADPTEFGAPGTPITYTYDVINTGNVTLNEVRVTDPHGGLSAVSCAPAQGASLDPGDQMSCTAIYTTSQADLNRGEIVNTGTVTGTSPAGDEVTDSDTAQVTAAQGPNITVAKTADPSEFGAAGTAITYGYRVTNNGNVTLDDVRVTDPHVGLSAISCAPAQGSSLEPGATMSCTARYTTTQADLDAGMVTNTATVVGEPPTGPNVTDSDQALITASHDPAITIQKTADPTEFGAAGTPITYTYRVTNTGNVTLDDVRVTDPHVGLSAVSCAPAQGATLAPGDVMDCTGRYTTTQADLNAGSITNTATVVGEPPTGPNVTDSDQALITATHDPAITIQKTADPTEFGAAGTPITYTYRVVNTGNVTLDDVRVTDPHVGLSTVSCAPAQGSSLDPGDAMDCTGRYTTTQADLNAGSITDTATVVGTPPTGPEVTDADEALIIANRAPNIDLVKTASPTEFGAAGTPITYTYLVTNNGNVTLDDVLVTDPHDGLSTITCDPAQGSRMDPGDQMTCTAGYTTTQDDLDAGEIINTGTATGLPVTGDATNLRPLAVVAPERVSDSDTAIVTAIQAPSIDLTKSADPTTVHSVGDMITYSYRVINNGNVTLRDVRVTDPHEGLSDITCEPAQGSGLDPGDEMTCTATYRTTQSDLDRGSIVNVGSVAALTPDGEAVTDHDSVTVTALPEPTPPPTPTPTPPEPTPTPPTPTPPTPTCPQTPSPTPPEVSPTPPEVSPTPPEVSPTPPEVSPTPPEVSPTPPVTSPTPPVTSPTPPQASPTPAEPGPPTPPPCGKPAPPASGALPELPGTGLGSWAALPIVGVGVLLLAVGVALIAYGTRRKAR